MADPEDAERATGYVVGGISPLGQKRALPTVLDESALALRRVYVSGGRRGLDVSLSPGDLVALTRAVTPGSPADRLTPRRWRARRSCGWRRWPWHGRGRAGPRGRPACGPGP